MTAQRPLYETAADGQNEQRVAAFLATRWGGALHKLPIRYEIDYFVPSRRMFVEIKCRTCRAEESPFFILSAAKLLAAWRLIRDLDAAVVFVFAFTDGEVRGIDARRIKRELIISGRRDRGDPQDIEPCVKIAPAEMTIIRVAGGGMP